MTKPTKWHVRPAKPQISLGIRPVWSESSLSAWRGIRPLATHWVHSKDSWSDSADAQADLSLCWAHMPFCWFCHEAAHFQIVGPKSKLRMKFQYRMKWNLPAHSKTNKMTCVPCNNSDQVWSAFSLCTQWVAKDPSFFMCTTKTLIRLSAQATDLSLGWAHRSFWWFYYAQAHILKCIMRKTSH